jgi:hypothetical protein
MRIGGPFRKVVVMASALAVSVGLFGSGSAVLASPAAATRTRPGTDRPASPRVAPGSFAPKKAVKLGIPEAWDTGFCPGFLPTDSGSFAPPGDVSDAWAPLQAQAEAQTEELYGKTGSTDLNSLYATNYARGVTRAFMFIDLIKAIDDVAAGTPGPNEAGEVQAFEKVVQYGREWVALDAQNLFDANNQAGPIQSSVTNDIFSVLFGWFGLPWQNQDKVPSVTDLLNQAQGALWGSPATATDDGGNQIANFPLGGAESQQATQRALDALVYLSAIGQTQLQTGGAGSDSGLDSAMGEFENAIGQAVGGGELAGSIAELANIATAVAGVKGGIEHASLIESLVNVVWQGADTVATNVQINDNLTASTALPSATDLRGDLGSTQTFDELFSDFTALTLHTAQNAGATGNDPDCRQLDKTHAGSTPLGPTGSDPEFIVQHVQPAGTADYTYTVPTLGGARSDAGNSSGEISDPGVIDWSLSRDSGPGAPRLGANWPISEVTYGVPGPPGSGYLLNSPAPDYPASGSWYLTFNGADGQQHRTANLTVSVANGTVHPTDSEVEQAIINADPTDFAQEPCSGPSASDLDPAVPAGDQGQGPCTDWNWFTHLGTDLLVSGDQPDGNKGTADYQVIFDIMVKGDLGGWTPVFTAHTDTCGNGGICVFTLLGAPLLGQNITTSEIWPVQNNDVCQNDPATCPENATFGWGDQVGSGEPPPPPYPVSAPYPVSPECQSVSPVAGLLQLEYVGEEGGKPNCDSAPDARSWVMSPEIRYRSYFGSFWTAWRVPASVGTKAFLNIETAGFSSGMAGIDPNCGDQSSGAKNAVCLEGNGTHWSSEFAPGDQILLEAPNTSSGDGTDGLLSVVRTVANVLDDTHMTLRSSAECLSGSDGNDCDFFNTSAYTSFMNPADGNQGDRTGMLTLPCGDNCTIVPTNFQFDIWKLAGVNAGQNCSVWAASEASPHPPTTGCYYSNTLQFRAQDGGAKGWWNASLPVPSTAARAARLARPAVSGDGPWIHAPVVTAQPANALVGSGGTAVFTVADKGSPAPSVQWQVSTDQAKAWSNLAGATGGTLSIAATPTSNGDDYRAVIKNANGSRTTQWGTLEIVAAPVITKNPTSTKTLHRGQNFSFSAAASGDPAPSPTWEISLNGGSTWQVLATGRSQISFSLPKTPPPGQIARLIRGPASAGPASAGPASAGPASAGPASAGPQGAQPKYLVRVIYQNAYGSATSSSAVLAFADNLPDVSPAVTVTPTPAAVGYPATALVTVGDYSGVRATKVKAVATFGTALGMASLKQIAGPTAKCVAGKVTGGVKRTCSWAALPAHSEAKFVATLRPQKRAKTGAISVQATIAQHNGSLGLVNVTVPISKPWADLRLTGTAKKTVKAGAVFSDVLTVSDGGPAAATKAKLVATLPVDLKLLKATAAGAKCAAKKGVLTCSIARVRVGHPVRVTLSLKAGKKGSATLVAGVNAATRDYSLISNSLSLSTTIK